MYSWRDVSMFRFFFRTSETGVIGQLRIYPSKVAFQKIKTGGTDSTMDPVEDTFLLSVLLS